MPLVFNENGVLSPGDYPMTIEQLKSSLLVQGPGGGVPWNQQKRFMLVTNLSILVDQLHQVGIDEIFIDGSFVEDKANPSDIDGYFATSPYYLLDIVRDLNKIDPHKIWTWDWKSRVYDRNSSKPQLPMWYRYKVELYPHVGQESGILDEYGHQQMFPAAFRKTRDTFLPKGIIKIIK
ncbi:hypothetical protein ABWW58_15510 [Sporolactobacillus sp. STCC-11]|uniref:DUF6932 family protein n=1 Tax=Sporolactobacillus caesalpiniae TaxID=3230362 RepID=UPI00339A028B